MSTSVGTVSPERVPLHEGLVLALGDDPLDERVPLRRQSARHRTSADTGDASRVPRGIVVQRLRKAARNKPADPSAAPRREPAGTAAALPSPNAPCTQRAPSRLVGRARGRSCDDEPARGIPPRPAHSSQSSRVTPSTPSVAATTNSAPVPPRGQPRPQIAGEVRVPGRCRAGLTVIPVGNERRQGPGSPTASCLISTSSKSLTVVPSSTRPRAGPMVPVVHEGAPLPAFCLPAPRMAEQARQLRMAAGPPIPWPAGLPVLRLPELPVSRHSRRLLALDEPS